MRDSPAVQARILRAATGLFVEQGFEGTTFRLISKTCGVSVGSINHHLGDKAQLAVAVHQAVLSPLIAAIECSLRGHENNLREAISALLAAYFDWVEEFPTHLRLMRLLEASTLRPGEVQANGMEECLGKALSEGLDRLSNVKLAPRSPSELYVIVLAPAVASAPTGNHNGSKTPEWIRTLTDVAIAGLPPAAGRLRNPKTRTSGQDQPTSEDADFPDEPQRDWVTERSRSP
jgi:AcrR family transcriptional regulator